MFHSQGTENLHIRVLLGDLKVALSGLFCVGPRFWGRGSGGVKSAGVSQSVRETGRERSQSAPSPRKTLQNKGFGAPNF